MKESILLLEGDSCHRMNCYMNLNEAVSDRGLTTFRGKFQEAEAVNKNKRMYPYVVLDENVKRLQEVVSGRGLVGELDHPQDSIIHFTNASHVITKLWWEGNVMMGQGEILNTPHGKVLKALINDGVRVGISSRGVGNGQVDENGILVIGESYKLITFDAVADPSTFAAFQEKVVGSGKRESYYYDEPKQNYQHSARRNDTSSIHNGVVSKEALFAVLSGIFKESTKKLKSEVR